MPSQYRPTDYGVFDRSWSLLFHIFQGLEARGPNVSQGYVDLELNCKEIKRSNFWPRLSTAENLLPFVTAEWKSRSLSEVAGRRSELWQVEIRWHDEMDVKGLGVNADLFAMMDDVAGILDGRKVSYYAYSQFPADYATGTWQHPKYAVAARDFLVKLLSVDRAPEVSERDRNVVRLQLLAIV